ncbi:MAG TPA: hypothetical protein VLE27_00475 [Thermoanaerobaculia bacterium]|nr:hypothetical protein [Thermoanaerobaculia bacterium]
MEEALMARFEEWFRETSRQIATVTEETVREIASLREETASRFDQTTRQIAALREETAGRFDQTALRFDQTGQEIASLGEEITSLGQEIASLGQETADRFVQTSREIAALRDQTALEFAVSRDETAVRFDQTTLEFAALREEAMRRFDQNEETARHTLVLMESLRDEIRLIAEAYLGVNERVERYHSQSTLTIEQVAGWVQPHFRDLAHRLGTLEGWKKRQEGDVLDAVRKLLERLSLQRAAKPSG